MWGVKLVLIVFVYTETSLGGTAAEPEKLFPNV